MNFYPYRRKIRWILPKKIFVISKIDGNFRRIIDLDLSQFIHSTILRTKLPLLVNKKIKWYL